MQIKAEESTVEEGNEGVDGGGFEVEEVDIVERVVLDYAIIGRRVLTSSETCENLIGWSL